MLQLTSNRASFTRLLLLGIFSLVLNFFVSPSLVLEAAPVETYEFVPLEFSWPTGAPYQSLVYFDTEIINTGTLNASGIVVALFVDGVYQQGVSVSLNGGGGSDIISNTWTAACGTHAIEVRVDYGNAFAETNESNNTLTKTFNGAPCAPTGVSGASPGSSSTINWSWSASTGATSYTIYNADNGAVIRSGYPGSPWTETGLSANTTYRRQVAGCNTASGCGPKSATAAATTPAIGTPSIGSPVEGVHYWPNDYQQIGSSGQVNWPWSFPDNMSGVQFQLQIEERYISGGGLVPVPLPDGDMSNPYSSGWLGSGTGTDGTTAGCSGNSCTWKDVTSRTCGRYWRSRVQAKDGPNTSAWSSWSSDLSEPPPTTPGTPTVSGTGPFTISWNSDVFFENNFNVYRNTANSFSGATKVASNLAKNTTSWQDTGVACGGNTYYYWIEATNFCANPPRSATAGSGTTGACAQPNLTIDTHTWPSTANLDSTVSVPFTVRNNGSAAATGFNNALYVNGTSVWSSWNWQTRNPGDSWQEAASFTLTQGSVTVYARADSGSNVTESNEGDNQQPATSFTITASNPSSPGTPTFTNIAQTSLTVNWANVTSETGYDIYRCPGSVCTKPSTPTYANIAKNSTSYNDSTGLGCGTTYRYWVEANSANGTDTLGSVANVTTSGCTCGDNSPGPESDYNSTTCTSNSYGWNMTNGNASGSCWSGKCCGDDSDEVVASRIVAACTGNNCPSFSSSSSDNMCATPPVTSCVYNGQFSSQQGDAWCLTHQGGALGWYDADAIGVTTMNGRSGCLDFSFGSEAQAGALGVGEYPDKTTFECCGDDSGEYYINTFCPGASGAGKCCSSASMQIDASGNCVNSCPQPDLTVNAPVISGSLCVNASQTLTATVNNVGGAATNGGLITVSYNNVGGASCSGGDATVINGGSSRNNYTGTCTPTTAGTYSVTATVGGGGEANTSNNTSSGTSVTFLTTPGSAGGLAKTAGNESSITWGWNSVSGATGYEVRVDGTLVQSNWGSTSYTASGLNCGESHTIDIRPKNSCGTASASTNTASTSLCVWDVGLYGACSVSSGSCTGTQTRSVTCVDNGGATVADSRCPTPKPSTTQSCNASNGTSCNADSNGCTQGDACSAGVCVAGSAPNCSDGKTCTADTCASTGNTTYTCNNIPAAGTCLISGTCYNNGDANPSNIDCSYCASAVNNAAWTNRANGTQCGSAINYCPSYAQSACDSKQHYKTCQAGVCSTSVYTADTDVASTACGGQSCGSYADYCLATPGKMRDYAATTGTCSASTNDTCVPPAYSDYCTAGTCGAECSDGNTCTASQCTGANGAFYQTRSAACGSTCLCPAWGSYGTCQESWNNCGQKVDCYTGTGCDTQVGVCACTGVYIPDPANPGSCKLPEAYNWETGTWSSCSVQCGTGTQTRTVVCKRQSDGQIVADNLCTPPKPSTSQSCNAGSCSATVCSPDGCYGTLKYRDYPASVANACVSGTCENNSCTYTEACSVAQCGAECDTNTCSTAQCDNNANGYRYYQTRAATCGSNCLCPAWSAYQTCQDSWNNCASDATHSRVQCYTGTGCNTAANACLCASGYFPNGSGGCSPDIPIPPSGLNFTNVTKTQLQVNWTDNATNETGYRVYRGTSSNVVATLGANATSWLDSPLNCGTSYTYWVAAYNVTGESSKISGSRSTDACGSGPSLDAVPGSSGGWQQAGTSITLQVSDSDGVAEARYKWNDSNVGSGNGTAFNNGGGITSPCPGSHTLYLWAKDNVNVESNGSFGDYQCDGSMPTVVSFSMENTPPGNAVTITASGEKPTARWNATDATSGINHVELWRAAYNVTSCKIGNTSGCNWGANPLWSDNLAANLGTGRDDTTAADTGEYLYGMHFVDNAGNCILENGVACGGTGNPVYVKMQISCALPDLSITDGVNASWNQSDTVAGTWSGATGSAVWGYSVDSACDGGDSYPGAGASATISSTYTNYLCFRNSNACGTKYVAQGPLKVDKDKPIPSFTVSPLNGTVNATVFNVDASTTADALTSQANIEVRWDWENDGTWDTSYSTIKTNTHVYTSTGTKTIRLEARDAAGNTDWTTNQVSVSGTSGPPNTPVNQSPANGATVGSAQPTLGASVYADPDGDSHGASQWQICTSSSCASVVWDSGSATPAITMGVPAAANLQNGTQYWWRVRYRDNSVSQLWSNYSTPTSFTPDTIGPQVVAFSVEGIGPGGFVQITATGQKPTARWEATDTIGVNRVELWRAAYSGIDCNIGNTAGCDWGASPVWTDNAALNTTGRDDTTATDTGEYLYGMHFVDNAGNCTLEDNQPCNTSGNPVYVDMEIVAGDFTIDVTPASGSVAQGLSVDYSVTLTSLGGFASLVDLSVPSGLGSGASASFNPPSCTPSCVSTMTISTVPGAATGDFTLTVNGTGAGRSRSKNVSLQVNIGDPPPLANYSYCRNDPSGQPYTVQFTDLSTDNGSISSRDWSFGDGTANSSQQNPVHTFTPSYTAFSDPFTESSTVVLSSHTPNTLGSGWTRVHQVGGSDIRLANSSSDYVITNSGSGWCSSSDGVIYQTNDIMPSPDYEVSVTQRTGDTGDDYNILAARIQDANNMYALRWNEDNTFQNSQNPGIFKRSGGIWTNVASIANTPISNNAIVTLKVDGATISARVNGNPIASYTDPSPLTGAGRAGLGMGAAVVSGDDCSGQQMDNFVVTVTSASPSFNVQLTVTDNGGLQDNEVKVVPPLSTISCSGNTPPNVPSNQTPFNASYVNTTQPTLTASAFSDPDPGNAHNASQWQVCNEAGCSTYKWNPGPSTAATYTIVPASASLVHGGTYWWRAQYRDNAATPLWSGYSVTTSFTVDTIPPIVDPNGFTVENIPPGGSGIITLAGEYPTVRWSTSDALSGIKQVELWRADYDAVDCKIGNTSGCSWSQPPNPIWTDGNAVDTTGRDDDTATNTGDYLYGMHVIDNAGNCVLENNQPCNGTGNPIFIDMDNAQSDFDFSPPPDPASQTVTQGNSAVYTISTTRLGAFTSSVTFTATGLGAGASASFNPAFCTPTCDTEMTVTTQAGATLGDFTITITGDGGGKSHETTVDLTVQTSSPAPVANYSYCRPNAAGQPQTVQFTDQSIDNGTISSWSWDFGDGSAVATDEDPLHTFPVSGPVFSDPFTTGSTVVLSSHTPNTLGSGWTRVHQVGGSDIRLANSSSDYVITNSGSGWCSSSDGVIYQTNDIMPSPDYEVSVTQRTGDTGDDYNILAARIQDANNMYALRWNEDNTFQNSRHPGIYKRVGGSWGTGPVAAITNISINNNSTVTLKVDGATISALVNGNPIASYTDPSPLTGAGRAGLGMGAAVVSGDDCSGQQMDNFVVTAVAPDPPFDVELTVTDNDALTGMTVKSITPLSVVDCAVNANPNQPVNQTPAEGAYIGSEQPTVTASAFSDSDPSDTHAQTQWQICSDSSCAATVWDSGAESAATTKEIPISAGLTTGTQYWWRVRYQDSRNAWSAYSSVTSFTVDTDGPLIIAGGFTVENQPPGGTATITTIGDYPTARWNVTDSGAGVDEVQLYRANYDAVKCNMTYKDECSWTQVWNVVDEPINSTGKDDLTATATGNYWYGVHVTDKAVPPNCIQENNQPCGTTSGNPIYVDMNTPAVNQRPSKPTISPPQ